MSASALAVMIVVCSLIWGGFTSLLIRAVRRESGKAEEHPPHSSP